MHFEYDENKSQKNLLKHGIDFVAAQALWNDAGLVMMPAKNTDEPRYLNVGMIAGKHYAAITTPRGENTRIISVRRARKKEVDFYEYVRDHA
jgi:uncharacterized DUF497 family protein